MYRLSRRKVFVSYHHGGDLEYYESFVGISSNFYSLVQDHSVGRFIGSADPDYVIRRIREDHLRGVSVTVVLCGRNTLGRKYVDWEILASLNQEMGLIGLNLPANVREPNGKYVVPCRLHDNIGSTCASFLFWDSLMENPSLLISGMEEALSRSKTIIANWRPRQLGNAHLR